MANHDRAADSAPTLLGFVGARLLSAPPVGIAALALGTGLGHSLASVGTDAPHPWAALTLAAIVVVTSAGFGFGILGAIYDAKVRPRLAAAACPAR